MGTITVSVEDSVEKQFRETVSETVGSGKGVLGKVMTEAMKKWVEEKRQKKIAEEMLALLDKGIEMGALRKFSRAELHER